MLAPALGADKVSGKELNARGDAMQPLTLVNWQWHCGTHSGLTLSPIHTADADATQLLS